MVCDAVHMDHESAGPVCLDSPDKGFTELDAAASSVRLLRVLENAVVVCVGGRL